MKSVEVEYFPWEIIPGFDTCFAFSLHQVLVNISD
jgi:hypothetical protein